LALRHQRIAVLCLHRRAGQQKQSQNRSTPHQVPTNHISTLNRTNDPKLWYNSRKINICFVDSKRKQRRAYIDISRWYTWARHGFSQAAISGEIN